MLRIRYAASLSADAGDKAGVMEYLGGWQQVSLVFHGLVRYDISRGREISISAIPSADPLDVRLFLLGGAIGLLLRQRGWLVLHGNAIRIGDACLVCVGDSGAGKSTLSAAFMQAGYPILADDVVGIDAEGVAFPGVRRIKLWPDAASLLDIPTQGMSRIRKHIEKYNLPLGDAYCDQPMPVRWVIELTTSDDVLEPNLRELSGVEAFSLICRNTYQIGRIEHPEDARRHMQHCVVQSKHWTVKQFTRPGSSPKPGDLVDYITRQIC